MPNNITGVTTWTTPIQTVADNDDASAANFALSPQGLTNRTDYLNANKLNVSGGTVNGSVVVTGSIASPTISAGTIQLSGATAITLTASATRTVATPTLVDVANKWTPSVYGCTAKLSSTCFAFWEMPAPHGSTITAVSAFTNGYGHGSLPATMPSVQLYANTLSSGSYAVVASASDSSGSVSAYESVHPIAITGMSVGVNRTDKSYLVQLLTESGANAVSGQQVYGVAYTVSVSAIDPVAG